MREHDMYRPTLEQILAFSGGRHLLTISDTARFLGRKREWCSAHLGITAAGITAEALAMKLAKGYSGTEGVRT